MKNLIVTATLSFLSMLPIVGAASALAQESSREFTTGYAGTLPGEAKLLARNYFNDPAIRQLIYKLEDGPAMRAEVEAALAQSEFTLDDLLRVKILREEDGRFFIAFNYFTAADMHSIHQAADKYVPSLVAAYQARKNDFDRIFEAYPAKSVSRDVLAFVFVAGFSLNWEGLQITEDNGWRRPDFVRGESPNGASWQYSFWASEDDPGYSVHGFYWGSSTFPGGGFNLESEPIDYAYSSFGDPYADPRMNFPDLLYLPGAAMAEPVREIAARLGLADRSLFGGAFELENALGLELARPVGAILFALRDHPQSTKQLRNVVDDDARAQLDDILALLEEIGYVEARRGKYHLLVPVFDDADKEMFDAAMALSREVLESWLNENYAAIREDLSGLTSLEHGVAFESLFTQIWHDFFGKATHDLAEDGFFADPASDAFKYKGSLPAVWRMSLYDLTLG